MEPQPVQYRTPAAAERRGVRYVASRTALYYLIFGLIWILASDWALNLLPERLRRLIEVVKGLMFVVVTAGLLFLLVRRFVREMRESEREAEGRLQGIAEQYRRLFERSPLAMIIFDVETRQILAANDVALILSGYTRQELLAKKTLDLMVEEDRSRAVALTASYREDAVKSVGPFQVRRRDGRIVFVEASTHLVDFDGKPARISLINDVTERLRAERTLTQYRTQLEQRVAERTVELSQANRRLEDEIRERRRIEEELRAATAAAEAANAAKSTFLANTSHEIRTPLTSILGYADLLADETLTPEERREFVGVVRRNARHQVALIDDLLDLSRAEMGKMRVTFGDHAPREIAQQAVELLRPRAQEKSLPLNLTIAADVPEDICTDGMRLRQILLNLLANAIKFTERGSVGLALHMAAARGDGMARLAFDVTDTGVGIEAEHLRRIFEPFYQVEQGAARRVGGVGLGLAIAQQLAIQMGGELTVKSVPGAGSTFTLVLPVKAAAGGGAESSGAPAVELEGRILLAEDTPNIRLLVEEYLTRAGAQVTAVADGAEAVERVREAAAGAPFDLILLDIHMPVLEGADTLKQIRDLGYGGPIVGLTAGYTDKPGAEWAAEGWSAMAAKPIDRQVFIPLLARLMAERGAVARA